MTPRTRQATADTGSLPVSAVSAELQTLTRVDVQLGQVIAELQRVSRAQERLARAVRALAKAKTTLPATPEAITPSPQNAPVWQAINQLAPDEGPLRRHLTRLASSMLLEEGATADVVAAAILRGDETDDDEDVGHA